MAHFLRSNRMTNLKQRHDNSSSSEVAGSSQQGRQIVATSVESGNTALSCAANCGHEEVVGLLLAKGANPDLGGLEGKTPLHEASREGHTAVVQLLLKNHADPNAQGCDLEMYAAARDRPKWTCCRGAASGERSRSAGTQWKYPTAPGSRRRPRVGGVASA